mgnify:FL=1
MARSAADVSYLFRAGDSPKHAELDPSAIPIPTGDPAALPLRGLRVGLYVDDGFFPAAASVARGVRRAAELLAGLGVDVVEFAPPRQLEILETYYSALSSDGGATATALVGDDPITPELTELMRIVRIPELARPLIAAVLERKGDGRAARLIRALRKKPVQEYWRLTTKRSALRVEVLEAWRAARIDAVLCPIHATPPMSHEASADFVAAGSYSMRYNFLNFPAGSAPIGRVRANETLRTLPARPDRFDKKSAAIEAGSAGLPLGVQIVAPPHRDDLVLALMLALDTAARSEPDFPLTPVNP